jgi:peptidyl-prolyl cis-trans isomerase SurA
MGAASNRNAAATAMSRVMIDTRDRHPQQASAAAQERFGRSIANAALLGLLATVVPAGLAFGQTSSIPGLVVTTTPPPQAPQAPPPDAPRQPVPPKSTSAAPPAPKARPAPKKDLTTSATRAPDTASVQGIAALVNDEPITAFEVQDRARFLALTVDYSERAKSNMKSFAQDPKISDRLKAILEETIKANPGKTREQIIAAFEERKKAFVASLQQQAVASARASLVPSLRQKALEELIEERLKLQEAKKLGVLASDADVEKAFRTMAERNKMTTEQFTAHIRSQGADARSMKARFKASFSWRDVVRRKYGHQINISSLEVDRIAAAGADSKDDNLELRVQKITLSVPGKIDQAQVVKRLAEAETLRQRFAGCKSTAGLAKNMPNTQFEELGWRKATALGEPTRTLLVNAAEGEMVPPSPTASGVELYAVCGRRTPKINEERRQAAESELQQKEFDRLAARHLADLRKDALIEIR